MSWSRPVVEASLFDVDGWQMEDGRWQREDGRCNAFKRLSYVNHIDAIKLRIRYILQNVLFSLASFEIGNGVVADTYPKVTDSHILRVT
jgi:hypothetical protein